MSGARHLNILRVKLSGNFFALNSKKNEYIWEEVHTISNLY